MPDLPADPAALRAAMRDDLVQTLLGEPVCPCQYYVAPSHAPGLADAVLARLSDRYDLDGWLAHLAAERAEEVRG